MLRVEEPKKEEKDIGQTELKRMLSFSIFGALSVRSSANYSGDEPDNKKAVADEASGSDAGGVLQDIPLSPQLSSVPPAGHSGNGFHKRVAVVPQGGASASDSVQPGFVNVLEVSSEDESWDASKGVAVASDSDDEKEPGCWSCYRP
jgi:hypothetical protein